MSATRDINRKNDDDTITNFINGEPVSSSSQEILELISPATGIKLLDVPVGCEEDVEQAVASASLAFDSGCWADMPPSQRQAVLYKYTELIKAEALNLDTMDTQDMGKPICLAGAAYAASIMRYCASAIDKVLGDVYTSDKTTFVTQQLLPQGVVAAIVPWNFPVINAVMKLAPALAAGNCVVLKPSEMSPRSAIRLVQLAIDAGVPPGVLNLVQGKGEIVGRALALHMDVNMITFTGSSVVGKLMLQYSGQSNMKLVHAECGGKSPQIVFDDFEDLDVVADLVLHSAFLQNQGQVCVAGSRLLVQKSIQAPLVEKITQRLEGITAGDPMEPNTLFGPLVSQQQMEKVLGYIASGKDSGADLIIGGNRMLEESGGYFVAPTLFNNVPPTAKIAQEEIFGPVLSVIPFTDAKEAIELANSTIYGLVAHVWTTSLSTGMKLSKALRAGTVAIYAAPPVGEGPGHAMSQEPYGQSGIGVENGLAGLEAYMRRQVTWYNHG